MLWRLRRTPRAIPTPNFRFSIPRMLLWSLTMSRFDQIRSDLGELYSQKFLQRPFEVNAIFEPRKRKRKNVAEYIVELFSLSDKASNQGRPQDFFQGVIGGGRDQWLGGTITGAEHEPITGVWGQSPQRGPGTEPLVRG